MQSLQPPTSLTDLELLQQIAARDEAAFSELYTRYKLPLYNFILRLTHQTTAAEDLLQEVFLAIWQGAGRFKGKSSVKTWMFRIAYHQSISWLRKRKNKAELHQDIDGLPLTSPGNSPEHALIEQGQTLQMIDAIQRLSHNHRSVVELTFVHGFSYQEIAKIMKCPVGTVKSRMSYALRYLKTDISNQP